MAALNKDADLALYLGSKTVESGVIFGITASPLLKQGAILNTGAFHDAPHF
jgi:hypothetical protein